MQVSVVQSSASTPSASVPPPPPPPPPHTHTLYVGWEKGGGERKIIMYGGTPAQFFFSVLTWSFSNFFQACASCIGERFSVQICASVWLGIIQAFNWWCSFQICPILPAFVDHIKQF